MAASQRMGTPRAGQTQVLHHTPTATDTAPVQAILHLRGATRESEHDRTDANGGDGRSERRIQWAEDVVDNEGLGRKTSKGS